MDTKNNSEEKKVYIPRCPTCGSPDIKKLSDGETTFKYASEGVGHPNYTFKTFVCNNCGYAW